MIKIKQDELLKNLNTRLDFNTTNDIVITSVSEDKCIAQVELSAKSLNPFGAAHGGLLFTLCDVVTGVLAVSRGEAAVTLSSSMEFLRGGRSSGTLYAVGTCVRQGRTIAVFDAEVFDQDDVLIARGTMQYYYTGVPLKLTDNE